MSNIEKVRHDIVIPPESSADIRPEFYRDEDGYSFGVAYIVCKTCNFELIENTSRYLFECPDCGYEITPKEVEILGKNHIIAIRNTLGIYDDGIQKNRFFLWRFLLLLAMKIKRLFSRY